MGNNYSGKYGSDYTVELYLYRNRARCSAGSDFVDVERPLGGNKREGGKKNAGGEGGEVLSWEGLLSLWVASGMLWSSSAGQL